MAILVAMSRSKLMATTRPAVKRTYEDYRATADDERYELLNGELAS